MPSAFASAGDRVLGSLRTGDPRADLPRRLWGPLLRPDLNSAAHRAAVPQDAEGFRVRVANGWVTEVESRQLFLEKHTGWCPSGKTGVRSHLLPLARPNLDFCGLAGETGLLNSCRLWVRGSNPKKFRPFPAWPSKVKC